MQSLSSRVRKSNHIGTISSIAVLSLILSSCQQGSSNSKWMTDCNYKDGFYEAYNWHCIIGDQAEKAACKEIKLIEIVTGQYPGVSSGEQAVVFWKGGDNKKLTYSVKAINENDILTCNNWTMIFRNSQYTEIFTLLGDNTVYSYGPSGSNVDKSRVKRCSQV